MKMIEELNVYVIHATHLQVRKPMCEQLREKLEQSKLFNKVKVHYIEDFDPVEKNLDEFKKHVRLEKTKNDAFDSLIKNLHIRQVSNTLKHYMAIKKVVDESNKDTISLIVEDDVVFSEQVDERLNATINALEEYKTWDCNFLGFPQPLNKESDKVVVNKVDTIYKIIPEVSSYLINLEGAKKMVQHFLPIYFTTHVQFSYIYNTIPDINFTMTTPNVFVDGSKFGVYLSNIDPNNKLFLNQDYSNIYKMLKSEELNKDQTDHLELKFNSIKFANHPEFLSLQAIYQMRIGNYTKSKELFDVAFKTFQENDCILNGDSEFLLNYSKIFRYLQN